MIQVINGSIYIHQGDDASFDIVFEDYDPEQVYGKNTIFMQSDSAPEDGTLVLFTVRVSYDKPRYLIKKAMKVYNGFTTIPLYSRDTACIPPGEYFWDIRFAIDNVDGKDVNTPFNPNPFIVTEVIGRAYDAKHAEYDESE